MVVEQSNDVLQELSQNDLHGLAPETEEEEILRNISDPSFELESIFAVISNGDGSTKVENNTEEENDTIILSVQQFQQQLEEFGQQQSDTQQPPQQQQKEDCLAVVTSSSFNMADSSCLYNDGTSNMAISNPLLHQRLTSSLNSNTAQGPGQTLLATVLASSSVATSSSTSSIASSTTSSTVVMPSSSAETNMIKEEVGICKYSFISLHAFHYSSFIPVVSVLCCIFLI